MGRAVFSEKIKCERQAQFRHTDGRVRRDMRRRKDAKFDAIDNKVCFPQAASRRCLTTI